MAETDLKLRCWIHPSVTIPGFQVTFAAVPFVISSSKIVVDLMDEVESRFESESVLAGVPSELQISVLWNTNDHHTARNPNDALGQHFESGDTFGISGNVHASTADGSVLAAGTWCPCVRQTRLS